MTAPRWQHRTIALAHDSCRVVTAEATVLGDWGFCETPPRVRGLFVWGWQVTHIPTGRYLVVAIEHKAVARQMVSRIARLTDWAQYPYGVDAPNELRCRLWEIVAEVQRAHNDRAVERWKARQGS